MIMSLVNGSLIARTPQIGASITDGRSVTLIHDDVISACRTIPNESCNLIVTSPPYNIGKSYETQTSLDEYLAWQEDVVRELVRVLSKDGSICYQVGNFVLNAEVFPLDIYLYPIFKKLGLKLRNRIVWHFEHGLHASLRFSGRYEVLLWFTKTDDYTFNLDSVRIPAKYPGKLHFKGAKRGQPSGNPLGKNPSDFWIFLEREFDSGIWEIPNVKANHPEKTVHPCQFPIELVERCVLAFTNEGDTVLDPFAGVGSSLIAGIKHNREVIGIERDQTYCEITKSRILALFDGSLKTRPLGKPVHKPSGREKVSQIPLSWVENR